MLVIKGYDGKMDKKGLERDRKTQEVNKLYKL